MRQITLTSRFKDFETDSVTCSGEVTIIAPLNDFGKAELQNLELQSVEFDNVKAFDDDGNVLSTAGAAEMADVISSLELYIKDNYIDMRWQ